MTKNHLSFAPHMMGKLDKVYLGCQLYPGYSGKAGSLEKSSTPSGLHTPSLKITVLTTSEYVFKFSHHSEKNTTCIDTYIYNTHSLHFYIYIYIYMYIYITHTYIFTHTHTHCQTGDSGLIPGSGSSPGEGNGNPPQYSCLENPMDGGAWWATVHGATKSRTRLGDKRATEAG